LAQSPRLFGTEQQPSRQYHVCLGPDAIERDPDLLPAVRRAGVGTVWLGGFFYGHWPCPLERLQAARAKIERLGMAAQVINVPLGHPGDSLGATDGSFPLTPPPHWKLGSRPEGKTYAGTSLHQPATAENVQALKALGKAGFTRVFLDDDFRLARGPGDIGGCFCAEHQAQFLRLHGYSQTRWAELLAGIRSRSLTPLMRAWIEFTADELTASFRAQRRALDGGELGLMAMYLGSEKAGIRLTDYGGVPFRVGELMFDDASFGTVKGKTDELFSALMHRRFCRPELAFSETTAYPAHRLSARNLAAKLALSTLADVRNTMFMSGVTPFPRAHWDTLGPAMKTQAALHGAIAGHQPRGPFKHFWGEASRFVGDDRPFSLFLASGIPFEVTDRPGRDGWTFLSDADARMAAAGHLVTRGTRFVGRPVGGLRGSSIEPSDESLDALFSFKAKVVPRLGNIPYVVENEPAICAWYPTAKAVLIWNPQEQKKNWTLQFGQRRRAVEIGGLELQLVEQVG
jgi:hypothetical protein